MCPHDVEYSLQICYVITFIIALHCDIIYVELYGLAYMLVKDRIHCVLVCCTCIFEAKGHHCVAVHSKWRSERYMLLIFWIHFDLIIFGEVVHKGHPLETAHIVNYDIPDRERKLVFRTSGVQIAEVYTNSNLSILFRDENNVGNPIKMLLLPDEFGVFLTSDLIASIISRQNHRCCLTGFTSRLMLRRCMATCGSRLGMSS